MTGLQHTHNLVFGSALARQAIVLARKVVVGLRWVAMTIETMQFRRRARLHLQSLDDRMLKDIGVSRVDVSIESSKPFWRE